MIFDDPSNKYVPYQRMANAIIDLTRLHGECELQDLLARGFTRQETADLFHMANAMADVELRLMEHSSLSRLKMEVRYA